MRKILVLILGLLCYQMILAKTITIAVASNFYGSLVKITALYQRHHQNVQFKIIPGSTGNLYQVIKQGLPIDLFLAADKRRPLQLINDGLAAKESLVTYARGRLILWAPQRSINLSGQQFLNQGAFTYLALAKPMLAPYGLAAKQSLQHMKLWKRYHDKRVYGENVSANFQLIQSGNAQAGFISLSQFYDYRERHPRTRLTSYWMVPQQYYQVIEQQLVLLKAAKNRQAAEQFVNYLTSSRVNRVIQHAGYW